MTHQHVDQLEHLARDSPAGLLRDERIFERTFVDADGEPVKTDVDYFAKGVREKTDTRILADETRIELFRFAVSPHPVRVTVKLRYEHAPLGSTEDRTSIVFYSEKRRI